MQFLPCLAAFTEREAMLLLETALHCSVAYSSVMQATSQLCFTGLMDIGVGAFVFCSGISSLPGKAPTKARKSLMKRLQQNAVLLLLGDPLLQLLDIV